MTGTSDGKPSSLGVDGLLPIHKPKGMISKDVSRWLVKRFGPLKLGHVGTLDPGASGVLPVLLGRSTRLQDYLLSLNKAYEFDLRLGFETDTLDLDGVKVRDCPWDHVTESDLISVSGLFLGNIEQLPPVYSAIKYRGKALYEYARTGSSEGLPLEQMKRKVFIEKLDFMGFNEGLATFKVVCSKGTYIRTLVKDIAEKIGSCATLTRLVRTEAAGIKLENTKTLDELESLGDRAFDYVIPLKNMHIGIPRWICPDPQVSSRLKVGQSVVMDQISFQDGLSPKDQSKNGDDSSVLLSDTMGDAFGIGVIVENMAGQIAIHMKRGF